MSNKRIFALLVPLMLIAMFSIPAQAKRPKTIKAGTWGGQHIQMNVANGSASIEYDCATATIDGPLKIDRRGRFDLRGTHTVEHPGPTRDERNQGAPARYSGWTDGKRMKLTVTLVDSKTTIGTFDLTFGSQGRVFKCR